MHEQMVNWKEGDIAVCVTVGDLYPSAKATGPKTSGPPPLRINAEYLVGNVFVCPVCKRTFLDVGIARDANTRSVCYCLEPAPGKGIWWCLQERFARKEIQTKEEQIEKAIMEENYELAEKLKNS